MRVKRAGAVLIVSRRRAVLHVPGVRAVSFSAADADHAAPAQHLQAASIPSLRVLLNQSGEQFRIESVPHARGADRRALLQRRLQRLFPDAAFCQTVRLRRGSKDGGEAVLFAALGDGTGLDGWLRPLHECCIPVAGVHTVPLVLPRLLEPLGIMDAAPVLLLSLHGDSLLRQTLYVQGAPRLSRLTELADCGADRAAAVAEEVRRLWTYAQTQVETDTLRLAVLSDPPVLDALRDRLNVGSDTTRLDYRPLPLVRIGAQWDLRLPVDAACCDRLLAAWLARHETSRGYARPSDVLQYRRQRAGRFALATGMASLFICASLAAGLFSASAAHRRSAEALRAQHSATQAHVTELRRAIALVSLPVGYTPGYVHAAVEAAKRLRAVPDLEPSFRLVSAGAEVVPELQLDRLEWTTSAGASRTNAASAGTLHQVLVQLSPLLRENGEPHGTAAILHALDRFTDTLRQQPEAPRVEQLSPTSDTGTITLRVSWVIPVDDSR